MRRSLHAEFHRAALVVCAVVADLATTRTEARDRYPHRETHGRLQCQPRFDYAVVADKCGSAAGWAASFQKERKRESSEDVLRLGPLGEVSQQWWQAGNGDVIPPRVQ